VKPLTDLVVRVQTITARPRVRSALIIAATTIVCLVIWGLRRPDQLMRPYVWAEEYFIINRWADHGFWSATFSAYQGYLLVPASAIVAVAAWADFAHLPQIAYILTTAVFLATILLLLIPKSQLPLYWRCALALLLVLTPTKPEVFGVALFAYWWTALWPVIALFWERSLWWLRIPVLVIGGLSGLVGAIVAVVYAVMFVFRRKRTDLVSAGVLGTFLVSQLWVFTHSARSGTLPFNAVSVTIQLFRSAGYLDFGWLQDASSVFIAAAGCALLAFLAFFTVRYVYVRRGEYREAVFAVAVSLAVIVPLSGAAAPLVTHPVFVMKASYAHPVIAAPRYYFYPFSLILWLTFLIVVVSEVPAERFVAAVVLGLSGLTLTQTFSWNQVDRRWERELARCDGAAEGITVPVFTDGSAEMWEGRLRVSAAQCERLGYRTAGTR
jgi:hypothetical protein